MVNEHGKPLLLLLTEGQMSDYRGAALLLPFLPKAKAFLADKGYDADWLREALVGRRIAPCIPSRKNRTHPIPYDQTLYKKRHKVENVFAKLKDWRRIAMRYDRAEHTFFSAICLAYIVLYYL